MLAKLDESKNGKIWLNELNEGNDIRHYILLTQPHVSSLKLKITNKIN